MKKISPVYLSLLTIICVISIRSCDVPSNSSSQIPYSLDSLSTVSIDSVQLLIANKVKQYGHENLLLVFDIDNTILTSTTDLGGDFWYQWQRGKLKTKPTKEQTVPHLFDVIPLLYELGTMRLTEPQLPKMIKAWQNDSIKFICLTARSSKARAATERELHKNGIFPENYALTAKFQGYPATFRHKYMTNDSTNREMTYSKGIAMVEGMNKGELLLHILDLTNSDFDAIIFVDDSKKNYCHVKDVFRNNDTIQMTAVHYTKIEDERKEANGGLIVTDKQAAQMHHDWILIKELVNEIYLNRIEQ